ncbi:MAG: hypothetical protein AAF297_04435 [Planctomycetota bacterium]
MPSRPLQYAPRIAPHAPLTAPFAAALFAVVGLANAQPLSEIDRARLAHTDEVENAKQRLPDAPSSPETLGQTPAARATPPRPGLTGGFSIDEALRGVGVDIPTPRALPENTFLTRRLGTAYAGPNGIMVFVPDEATRTPAEGPMVLAPNSALERLQASLAEGETAGRFLVSGEVLLYHGRNHLLVGAFARAAVNAQSPQPEDDTPNASDLGAEPASPSIPLDPSVAEIIADLERRRSAGPGGDSSEAASDPRFRQLDRVDPAARLRPQDTAGLLAEDSVLSQRRARLDRTPDGRWVVTFDNDADRPARGGQAAIPTPPMTLIPSAVLQRMERAAELFGDSAALTVSGRVMTYDGQNYLRPTMFVIERPGDIDPLQ